MPERFTVVGIRLAPQLVLRRPQPVDAGPIDGHRSRRRAVLGVVRLDRTGNLPLPEQPTVGGRMAGDKPLGRCFIGAGRVDPLPPHNRRRVPLPWQNRRPRPILLGPLVRKTLRAAGPGAGIPTPPRPIGRAGDGIVGNRGAQTPQDHPRQNHGDHFPRQATDATGCSHERHYAISPKK